MIEQEEEAAAAATEKGKANETQKTVTIPCTV